MMSRVAPPQIVLLLTALWMLACSSAEGGGGPQSGGEFGAPCQRSEDCASRLCIQHDESNGVCTLSCEDDTACPKADNWGCVQPDAFSATVCGCVSDAEAEVCGDGLDNECNGLVDDCQLCNGKPVPLDDPSNCGACGNACRADQICSHSECLCPPDAAFECGGACTDLEDDPENCGSCDVACSPGQSCKSGACGCESSTAEYCPGAGCVELPSDPAHCGSCGTACASPQSCVAGQCVCPSSTQEYCAGSGCVDTSVDVANCGSCGNDCPGGASCKGGACSCPLASPDACADQCTNLATDEANCGACGTVCDPQKSCVLGVCKCAGSTSTPCGSGCANTYIDPLNCGVCGNTCLPSQVCTSGACACPSGQSLCAGTCVPLTTTTNCGACGTSCLPSQICSNGACVCPFGQTLCGGSCVSLGSDSTNCGACGNVCPSGQACSASSCKCTSSGLTACGALCVNLTNDTQNCGTCGTVCPPTQACTASVCKCASGTSFCAAANACVNLQTDTQNCGACANACKPGQQCSGATCTCPLPNELWCDQTGVCTDIQSNPNHCGTCGKVCPAATSCVNAACKCDQAGYTLCSGTTCHDLQTDPDHCGNCATACVGNMGCSGGSCFCPSPVVGAAIRLTNNTLIEYYPNLAAGSTHAGLIYLVDNGGWNLYFALLNLDGTRAITPDIALTNFTTATGQVVEIPDITWSGTEFAVTWRQHGPVGPTVRMFQRISAAGTPISTPFNVTAATPGTTTIDDAGRILWSSVNNEYALTGEPSASLQRLGPTGTTPLAVTYVSATSANGYHGFALSPAGEWGVLTPYPLWARLALFNPNGSNTKPALQVSLAGLHVDLVHDGTTWLSGFTDLNNQALKINRGEQNTYNHYAAVGSGVSDFRFSLGPASTLEVTTLESSTLQFRRFLVPPGTASTLTPLGTVTPVLATPNAVSLDAVHTSAGALVAWSDNRWGAPELYVAPIDLFACP